MSSLFDSTISHIYKEKNICKQDHLSEKFWSFCEKNFVSYNINNKNNKELEIIILKPSFEIFSILFNYDKSVKNSYIEIVSTRNNEKLRYRKNISELGSFINNKNKLLEDVKNDNWEFKETILTENYSNFIFKSAMESYKTFDIEKGLEKFIKYYIVNTISITNNYFKAEIKLKTQLDSSNLNENNFILSYFESKNIKRSLYFEVELRMDLKSINKKDFKESFLNILQYSMGVSKSNFYFCFDPLYENIKTKMIFFTELIDMDYSKTLVMKKVDGESVQFYVKNKICYIIKNNIILELNCNIKEEYEICGSGEFLYNKDNIRVIYPFHIKSLFCDGKEIKLASRKDSFKILKILLNDKELPKNYTKKININKDEILGIYFCIKDISGPFESEKDFFTELANYSEKICSYPTDGIIISNNDLNDLIDFKLKKDNTIDLYTTFHPGYKKDNNNLNFNLSFIEKGKSIKQIYDLYKCNIASSSQLYYNYNLSMIVYIKNGRKLIFPVVFISEYSIDQQTFVPRLDKTNKFLQKRKYFGNCFDVIIYCIVIHKYKFYLDPDTLKKIINNNDNENLRNFFNTVKGKIQESILAETKKILNIEDNNPIKQLDKSYSHENDIPDDKYIITPLNKNKNWYKEETNNLIRSDLNKATNLVKTFGISSVNRFATNNNYNNIFVIYCGKGGDIGKYVNIGFKYLVGIDPDNRSLNQFNERTLVFNREKTKIFNSTLICLSLERKDFLSVVYEKIGANKTFDVIDIQLGLHFSLTKETEDHILKIIVALSNKNKKPKTKVLISTNDKDNIIKLFKERNEKNSIKLKVNEDTYYEMNLIDDGKMKVFFSSSMNEPMEEYLISKNYLISLFNKYGFNLLQTFTFDEVLKMNSKEVYQYMGKAFKRYSAKDFLNLISNINYNPKDNDIFIIMQTFRYYIFEES